MKTLYVSDVDGTIYRAGQEELRESSRALFEQILSRGTLLTVASGRNLHGGRTGRTGAGRKNR